MKSFIGYLWLVLALVAVTTLAAASKELKHRKRGVVVKRQSSGSGSNSTGDLSTSGSIPVTASYQVPPSSPSGQQAQSYSGPSQLYHARPVSYTPPQITFHPPKIYMTKPVVTVSQAIFQTEGGPPVYQTATYTTRRSSNSTEEVQVNTQDKSKNTTRQKRTQTYGKPKSQ